METSYEPRLKPDLKAQIINLLWMELSFVDQRVFYLKYIKEFL